MALIKDGKIRFSVKVTLILGLFISALIIAYTQKQNYLHKRERCQLLCQTAANQFHTDFYRYILISDILEAMIIETNGNLNNFDRLASDLISKLPAIESIRLAPKGEIKKVYPRQDVKGNLFSDPTTSIGSNFALQTRQACLSGPVLIDNKNMLIIQQPVFLPDEKNTQHFWGFIVFHLKLDSIFNDRTLNLLSDSGYKWILWKSDTASDNKILLAGNTELSLNNPCESVLKITNAMWTLSATPFGDWVSVPLILIEIVLALIACLSVSTGLAVLISIKDREESLERLSFRDALTDLYNSRKYISTLRELQNNKKPYSLIYMDLNDFKHINDNYGHEAGDQVLSITGRKIHNCIRESDMCFRIGGDEFAVILNGDHDAAFVQNVVNRIKASIERETVLSTARLILHISAGFARCPHDSSTYEEIVKIADAAMYSDKRKMKENKQ